MRFLGEGREKKHSAVHHNSEDVLLFLSPNQRRRKKTITESFQGEMIFQRIQ